MESANIQATPDQEIRKFVAAGWTEQESVNLVAASLGVKTVDEDGKTIAWTRQEIARLLFAKSLVNAGALKS